MVKKIYVVEIFSNGSFYFYNNAVLNTFKNFTIYKKDFKNAEFYKKKTHFLKNISKYNDLEYRNKFFNKKLDK